VVSGAGTFGATVGSDAVVAECMTAAGAFEPSGRRWAFNAIKPSVSAAPTTRKYFKINIIAPRAACPAASQLVAPGTCGVHLQPYIDTGPTYFPAHRREPAGDSSNSSGDGATWQIKKPARDFSRRAYVDRALAPAGTSAVGSSVANNNLHIGENHEYSMTMIRRRRWSAALDMNAAPRARRLAPGDALR